MTTTTTTQPLLHDMIVQHFDNQPVSTPTQPQTINNYHVSKHTNEPTPILKTDMHMDIINILAKYTNDVYNRDKPDIIEESISKILQQLHTYFDIHNDVFIAGEIRRALIPKPTPTPPPPPPPRK